MLTLTIDSASLLLVRAPTKIRDDQSDLCLGKVFSYFILDKTYYLIMRMVPNVFLVLGRSRMYFINVVGTCSYSPAAKHSTGCRACTRRSSWRRARSHDRRAWQGCRLRRAGARFDGRELKAGDTGFAQFCAVKSARHDVV